MKETCKMLEKSKYNIVVNLASGPNRVITNSLYGTADILNEVEYQEYQNNQFSNPLWKERGYAVDLLAEKEFFGQKYLDFLDMRHDDEVQLFFVPTYDCNFECTYCYQSEYAPSKSAYQIDVVDAFFKYIETEFGHKKKYLTLFGGEPLLPNSKQKETILYFLEQATLRELDTAIVTNGYHLQTFVPYLKNARIREVQVTLDGTEQIHNQRRPKKNGEGTFHEIVKGIDALVESNIPVNLRMVVDSRNMKDLPKLAQFAIDRGWTKSSSFKTQLGRNYELHSCQHNANALYSRVQMYAELAILIQSNPHILDFHQPPFHFMKSLSKSSELPMPLFDACPGCKTEWAFDINGNIYSCTATVGKKDECLGTFYPEIKTDEDAIELWQERDILAIEECKNCSVALVCGGGCGSVAKNNNGSLHSPNCRPVQEIAQIGASLYFDKQGVPRSPGKSN